LFGFKTTHLFWPLKVSYLLWIAGIITPNKVAVTIRIVFNTPSVPRIFFIIVEIIKPEFLITVEFIWKEKERNSSSSTSIKNPNCKNSSRKFYCVIILNVVSSTFASRKKLVNPMCKAL
jgi:hypothetical protein